MRDVAVTSGEKTAESLQGRDLRAEERKAAAELQLGRAAIPMLIAAIGLIVSFFLPHSGVVLGFDVLLDTDVARKFFTTAPERIYSVLVVVGVLLAFATLLTRTTAVAFVAWAVSSVQAVYSVFAGWMRQSRPQELAGEGIAWGLALSIVCSFLLAITLSIIAFRRTRRQHELANERRVHADSDPVLRAQQAYLRSGLTPNTTTDVEMVDDRRQRAKRRHRD